VSHTPAQLLSLALLAATAVAACDRRSASSVDSARHVSSGAKPSSPPWYLESAEGCGFIQSETFPDPIELVRHYVTLDSAGVFLASTPVMDSVYLCAGHLPGPDAFSVVKQTEIRLLSRNDTAAQVLVSSLKFGIMTSDSAGNSYLIPNPARIVDTFQLVHTAYGWRIESPQLPDRVHAATVLDQANKLRVRQDALDSVRAFLSRPGV
jgi:hypothetical protein